MAHNHKAANLWIVTGTGRVSDETIFRASDWIGQVPSQNRT